MDEQVMVCGVCGRVLDYYEGRGHDHSLGMTAVDHVAVPVPEGSVPTVGMCDFCYAPDPDFVLPVRSFDSSQIAPGTGSEGDWAACNDCAILIRRNQWTRLFERAKASWQSRHGPMPPMMETGLRRLYREVRANSLGDVQPLVRPGR